jgi:hypothetical protein
VHVVPEHVVVRGFAGSEAVFEKQVSMWYLLAGGRRDVDLPLAGADCARADAFQVEVAYGDTRINQRIAAPAGACSVQ